MEKGEELETQLGFKPLNLVMEGKNKKASVRANFSNFFPGAPTLMLVVPFSLFPVPCSLPEGFEARPTAFHELLPLFVLTRFAAKAMSYSVNGQSLIILSSRRPFTKSVLEKSLYTL